VRKLEKPKLPPKINVSVDNPVPDHHLYTATLTTGSLKPRESRIVAGLLLENLPESAWKDAIGRKNILQARAPGSAGGVARLLRARLECFDAPLWLMVRDGNKELSAQALLACAVKHSALLRDFMDLTLRDEYRMFRPTLAASVWPTYLEGCRSRDPAMPDWSESTQNRLRSTVFQILSQAGYLSDTAARELKTVTILPALISYLREKGEDQLIRCLQLP
jgi:hypothetical protein